MTIEETVQALLEAALPAYGSPPVDLVAASRIKVPGNWQNLAKPYIVHFPAAPNVPMYMHSGMLDLDEWPFYQVSVFDTTYSGARTVANAVVATLEGTHSDVTFLFRGMMPMPYEADVNVQQIVLEFQIFEAL